MEIRAEEAKDIAAIYSVNAAAFGRADEADLVNRLRGVASTFSFVAVDAEQIVGHIFFRPVTIPVTTESEAADDLPMLGLAPLAVVPHYQRRGIGALLVAHGLQTCARFGFKAVVVLGSPQYYSQFGFVPAKEKGLKCEYPVPDEAFMVLELENGALAECVGIVKYHAAFNDLE